MNLLSWVSSQQGKIATRPQENHLTEVFEQINDFAKANVLQKEISISFNSRDLKVYADYEMLITILRNLISNSIKFTPKKGSISVEATMDNGKTTIKITDTGIGMPKDLQLKLKSNEILPSAHGTENETGTGLGLFLCKDFVQKNKGNLYIESEIGKGTIIKLIFPSGSS